jgi:hypothetical protein
MLYRFRETWPRITRLGAQLAQTFLPHFLENLEVIGRETNINVGLTEIWWQGTDWSDREWWRARVNAVANRRTSQFVIKFFITYVTVGFSWRAKLHEVRLFPTFYRSEIKKILNILVGIANIATNIKQEPSEY